MKPLFLITAAAVLALSGCNSEFTIKSGSERTLAKACESFELSASIHTSEGATAELILFRPDGYRILIGNGPIDGTLKTGSLLHVRNLYRSLADDADWFDFAVTVKGANISVKVNDTEVVNYTEPENPYRTTANAAQLLSEGPVRLKCTSGSIECRGLKVSRLPAGTPAPADALQPVDEQADPIIRLQQEDFPVIDYHVHLKGGLTKEQAHTMSMQYGINYGVAPNAGEGGVGRMLADDKEVYEYYDEVFPLPFLCGVQGEGRKWTQTFSQEALGTFDYLFTDAMTIIDHKGRNSRIYRAEEVRRDGISLDGYMQRIVDQTVLILKNEPADIFANPTYIPEDMQPDYDNYWTDERIDAVLDVMEENSIALEINPRYRIPSMKIIRMAKARGLKFVFGTNNVDADFGKLEYCIDAVRECGITADDIWFPSMSVRRDRPVVIYNKFD